MKKLIVLLMAFALALVAVAAAESDYTYFPESEEYVGTWYVDDYILEIVHSDDDYNLFNCIVTQYESETEGTRWIYDSCSYDDVGKALASLEIGMKFHVSFDDTGDLLSSEPVYFDDGAAAFALNEDGTLTWTDFKEAPGEDVKVFQKVVRDVANPVAAYEGTWVGGRATLVIEDLDDVITCTIHWGGSASEAAEWVYEGCMYDEVTGGLSTLETGVKREVTYAEGGEVASAEVIYEDGAASFVINDEGKLVWTDYKETPGENEVVFERQEPLADYSLVTTMDRSLVEAFAATVRQAYLEADWNTLAPLIDYPITVAGQELGTPQEFTAYMFEKVPAEEDAAAMEEEDCKDLFVNGEGICLGDGEIWLTDVNFDGVGQTGEPLLKIIAINGVA